MVDLRPIDAIAMHGIEAVTLSEPVLESSWISHLYRGGGAILSVKLCAGVAGAVIFNPSIVIDDVHVGVEIWEVVCGSGGPGRNSAAGIQGEKENSWLAAIIDVGSDVQFGESRKPRQRRSPAWADSGHVERSDGYPTLPVKGVQRENGRNQC